MEVNVGSIVTRISHDNDIVFVILRIEDDIAYLKGLEVRLYADSPVNDLVLTDKREEYEPEIEIAEMNRDEYFYMPGKILHIDGDEDYLNKSLNYYKKAGVYAVGKKLKKKMFLKLLSLC